MIHLIVSRGVLDRCEVLEHLLGLHVTVSLGVLNHLLTRVYAMWCLDQVLESVIATPFRSWPG